MVTGPQPSPITAALRFQLVTGNRASPEASSICCPYTDRLERDNSGKVMRLFAKGHDFIQAIKFQTVTIAL
jgi:hypothetical protein